MNNTLPLALAAALIAVAQAAFAHDPAEHAKEAAQAKKGANCAALKGMDRSKTDPNDVVMKAMMAKCGMAGKAAEKSAAMPAAAAKKPDAPKEH